MAERVSGSCAVVEERNNKSSWHFIVSEICRHPRGHTLYKVTLQIVPVDVSASIKEVVWWKRYTELQVVHKHLSQLHTALFLKGTFPQFPKPTVLHRHDEEVIEHRRHSAEKVLNFISSYPILCRNEVFKDFLKGGQEVIHSVSDYDHTEPLKPNKLYLESGIETSPEPVLSSVSDSSFDCSSGRAAVTSPISGIWRHRLDPDIEDELTERSSTSPEDVSLGSLDDSVLPSPSDDLPSPPLGIAKIDNCEEASVDIMTKKLSPEEYVKTLVKAEGKTGNEPVEEDYLFMAGHHLARANDKELAGDYEVAFGLYKLGIDILLRGVQSEADDVRRDAVRRKAAKYLAKAEDLYTNHINGDHTADSLEPLMRSEYSAFAGSIAELHEYTVLTILDDAVLLVMHKNTRENFVIKSLTKSPRSTLSYRKDRRTIVPTGYPKHRHMVQLKRFVETDNALHLILEKAPGGKLWNYVVAHASHSQGSPRYPGSLGSSNSISSDMSACGSDYSASWQKLVNHLPIFNTSNPPDDQPDPAYSSLCLKYSMEGRDSRKPSLTQVDTSVIDNGIRIKSESLTSTEESTPLDEIDLTYIIGDITNKPVFNSDAAFLQDVEPQASPTLRALTNWADVGSIDSDHLIAKSRELLQSVDRTIGLVSQQKPETASPSSQNREPSIQEPREPSDEPREPSDEPRKPSDEPREPSDEHIQLQSKSETIPPSTALDDNNIATSSMETDENLEEQEEKEFIMDSIDVVKRKRLPESVVKVWIAEIILAVEALHDEGFICGTLTMDNVLLGEKGHIKLTYFCQWNSVVRDVNIVDCWNTLVFPPEYRKVNATVEAISDSWSIGVILFELLSGQRFYEINNTLPNSHRSIILPDGTSDEANDLLKKLLKVNPRERLSLMETKQHPFFRSLNWKQIRDPF